jgi:hypothetical protein
VTNGKLLPAIQGVYGLKQLPVLVKIYGDKVRKLSNLSLALIDTL